jgi:hypothetical protein
MIKVDDSVVTLSIKYFPIDLRVTTDVSLLSGHASYIAQIGNINELQLQLYCVKRSNVRVIKTKYRHTGDI